jgi:hypothetical protein
MLTGKHLEAYLAHVVLGRKLLQRERIGPRSGPPRKGAPRDEDYEDWIRSLACCACGVEGRCEAAHTGTDGDMSMKASDYSCVPLCSDCHTQAPGAYHRVGKRAFERSQSIRRHRGRAMACMEGPVGGVRIVPGYPAITGKTGQRRAGTVARMPQDGCCELGGRSAFIQLHRPEIGDAGGLQLCDLVFERSGQRSQAARLRDRRERVQGHRRYKLTALQP